MSQYDDDDSQTDPDYAGMSPAVRLLHQVFAKPVERLGDVTAQLLGEQPVAPTNAPARPPGVDWGFITDREGSGLNGYVPQDRNKTPFAHSGVTIAHGFDLGGRSGADLQKLGLRDDVTTMLTPYVGPRGQAAQDLLNARPLNISPQQQDQIDNVIFNSNYNRVAKDYNAQTTTGTRFQDLPQGAQTAIMDVAHQYGPNLAVRTPNFWNQAVSGQWQAARDNLMNFGDANQKRRQLEGNLIQNEMDSGTLP